MSKVMLSLPRLGVKRGGWEKNKEIYVLAFATDLRKVEGARLPGIVAAYNETLPNVVPDVAEQALLEYVLLTVSNTFARIRPDQPVSLSGSGILLYPHLDPQGLLAAHFVVVENDAGKRNLGKLLDNLFADGDIQDLVAVLARGATPPALAALMNILASRLPSILRKNKDDFLFAHSHSGFDFDDYGCRPGETSSDFELENDRVFCTLRVTCRHEP